MTKILIVEDESSFSEALSFLLGKEGYEVAVAATLSADGIAVTVIVKVTAAALAVPPVTAGVSFTTYEPTTAGAFM